MGRDLLKETIDYKVDPHEFIAMIVCLESLRDDPVPFDTKFYRAEIERMYSDNPVKVTAMAERMACMYAMRGNPDSRINEEYFAIPRVATAYAAAIAPLHIVRGRLKFNDDEFYEIAKSYKEPVVH